MSALSNPVIGLLTLHMSKPSQHATTNTTIHTLDTQPTPELFTFSSVLQGHSRHPPNHTILRSHEPSHINRLQLLPRSQHNLSYFIHHLHTIPRTVPALEVPHLRYLR